MARRHPRRGRKRNSPGVQLVQIVGLGLLLVMIILFRDEIAGGAGDLLGGFDSEDIEIEETSQPADGSAGAPAAGPDAGTAN